VIGRANDAATRYLIELGDVDEATRGGQHAQPERGPVMINGASCRYPCSFSPVRFGPWKVYKHQPRHVERREQRGDECQAQNTSQIAPMPAHMRRGRISSFEKKPRAAEPARLRRRDPHPRPSVHGM